MSFAVISVDVRDEFDRWFAKEVLRHVEEKLNSELRKRRFWNELGIDCVG